MLEPKSRVFAFEPCPRFDLSEAVKFGEIYYLVPDGRLNPFNPDRMKEQLLYGIEKYKYVPNRDHILLTGIHLVVAVGLSLITARSDCVNILLYDCTKLTYSSRVIVTPPEELNALSRS